MGRMLSCLRESLAEYERRGNFVRIYPAPGTDMYDCFFAHPRPFNRFLYKVLYSDEIIHLPRSAIRGAEETLGGSRKIGTPDTK